MRTATNRLIISIILPSLFFVFSCKIDKQDDFKPTVEIKYEDGNARLYRHGEPYVIKGAAGTQYMDKVAAYGANSIRTWNLQDADSILDKAYELGLTVTLGLEIGRPHWGNDFKYWKFWEVNKKIEELKPIIEKYKNHPALLMWGVGNEVKEYGGGKRIEVFYITNKVAKMIKELDPNHPTIVAVNNSSKNHTLTRLVLSNIDILGFNSFKNLNSTAEKVYGEKGWKKAYIFSEWGSWGHWQVTDTEWELPKN